MSNYRTIELSEPQYERDNLRLLTFKSQALRGRGDVTLFVPSSREASNSVPLVILLHGVYGSHWAWSLKGGAHLTINGLINRELVRPMVLAMPSDGLWGDGSGYIKHEQVDYERWIMDDVVGCVTEVVPCLDTQSPLFIAGLSMGGYGALRLGAKYAQRISGISGHSSITHPNQLSRFVEEPLAIYGPTLESEDADVLYWIKQNRDVLPPLRFDCGTSDSLIEENRQLHRDLTANDIAHDYFEFDGEHSWSYWREHLADTLLFFERLLSL